MDDPVGGIQQEFGVIHEQGGTQLKAQVAGLFLDQGGVRAAGEDRVQTGPGRFRLVREGERGDAVAFVRGLAGHAVGGVRAGDEQTVLRAQVVRLFAGAAAQAEQAEGQCGDPGWA